MQNEKENDTTREVKHQGAVVLLLSEAPTLRIKPKPKNVVIIPPTASLGAK